MKILVLAHQLRAGGGKVTCINLLQSTLKEGGQHTYFLVVPDDPDYRDLGLEDRVQEVRYFKGKAGYLGLACFNFFTRQRYMRAFKPDLVWSMSGFGLISPPCHQAVSVQYGHLMYENQEMEWIDGITRIKLAFLRSQFRAQLASTDLIIFQTQTMRDRCLDNYPYQGRTLVTYKGLSSFQDRKQSPIPSPLGPDKDQFKLFYLTRYYTHKGLETLVEMMDAYREELRDVTLVITIAEEQHHKARELLAAIERKGLQDRVLNVGPLKQDQVANYYHHCDCLVMPTRLESFSGTYLEAMHYGLPILTSDLDFAREICGPAAVYFDPRDTAAIKDALLEVKNDPRLREQLIASGRRRLDAEFNITWDEIAREILTRFDEIL